MSNVDSLLDLDSPVENHGSKQTEIGSSLDPFDPFGPSPAFDSKGNDLLLSFESSVQNGTSTQQNGSENVNLLYEFESGNTNPLYNMTDDNLEDIRDEDLSALIKQQASDQDDSMVTETITRSEDDGQTTIVTTRRSRSYDSDRELSPEVTQVTEEVMTTSDDGTTVKKVITTTTTQAEYYDGDDSEISDRPSSYIDQSRSEQSYDEPPSTEQSYDEQGYAQQSYENQPSAEESLEERQYYEEERSEEPSLVEVSYEERQSFEDNPSFAEPSEESLVEISDDHKRRSMTPSPSSSDDEQGPTRAEPDLYQRSSMNPSRPQTEETENQEEEIIKNGATFYRSKEADRDSSDEQEEVQTREARAPGQIKSPFFGDAPKPENGVDVDDVDRDPEIAREVRSKDNIKFAELNNFKNKFEAGVEGQKISTVSPEELEKLRQTTAAGSLKNKFENVAREEQNDNRERKGMREITPPQEGTKIVYETEPSRDPNVVRADDRVDEGEYMPKPGASREIMERFKSGKVQEQTTTKRTSVIDEIQKVEGGVFENEPQINPDVVRSGEGDVFADLPTSGSTRSVLSKFKQMESGGGGNVPAPRGVREITPPASGKVEYVSEPSRRVEKYEGKAESGVFESKPQERPDVVKSGRVVSENEETEELPQKGFTKSAAALFRQKEAEAGKTKTASTGGLRQITPPRDTPVVYESEPQRLPDVVRSEDKKEEEDLPQSGAAKNMLAKFRQWESTGGPQSETPRKPKEFTPPKEGGVFENTPQKFVPDYETRAEGGVFENQPQHREDVVRSEDRHVEELPEQGLARNMVARFRQMSESTKSQSPVSPRSPHDRSFKEFTPPRDDPRSTDRPGVQPSDMPEQYQQSSGGISENTPQKRDDVVREADTDYQAGLPTGNTTKSMLARFKAIQTEVKQKEQPKPLRKEGGTSRFRPVQPEKCAACRKTVYAMEKMEFNKNVYHKTCFKCSHCKNRLTPGTFSVNQGILYCLNHFKQMFKTKGNYDEGFGREQYKKKWKSEPNIAGLSDDDHSSYRS